MKPKPLNEIEQAILSTLVVQNKESLHHAIKALKPVFERCFKAGENKQDSVLHGYMYPKDMPDFETFYKQFEI